MDKLNQELITVSTLDEALKIVNRLNENGIHNTYKVTGGNNTWVGRGTIRSYIGSSKLSKKYSDRYSIYVESEQYERAKSIIYK